MHSQGAKDNREDCDTIKTKQPSGCFILTVNLEKASVNS